MHMHKALLSFLLFQISTSLSFFQSTSGLLTTSSTEHGYISRTQYLTSLLTLFVWSIMSRENIFPFMDMVLVQSQKILVS